MIEEVKRANIDQEWETIFQQIYIAIDYFDLILDLILDRDPRFIGAYYYLSNCSKYG